MKVSKLRQHIIQVRGISFKPDDVVSQPKDGYVSIIKSNNIKEDGFDDSNLIYINRSMVRPEQFIKAGDLVLTASSGSRKTIGKNIQFEQDFNGSFGAFCKLVRPKKSIHAKYLYHFFRTRFFRNTIEMAVQGANIANLKNEYIDELQISLPPLDHQIRIAHLLGKTERLITQRKHHMHKLDELIKSVFLEIFGDPVRNEKEWDIQPCDKAVLNISSGTSYGGEERPFANDEEIGVLKISAVTKGTFDPTEFKVVNQSQIKKSLRFVKRGDVLFSRANTIELVAACCVVMQEYDRLFLPDKLWVLTLNEQLVNSQFFNYLLKNERYRNIVRSLASGGHDSMLNISMKKFMTLDIPCPPVELQNKFAVIVEKIEGLKTRYQKSLADLEGLYGTLSQKAFSGELNLSRIPLPTGIDVSKELLTQNNEVPESDITQLAPLTAKAFENLKDRHFYIANLLKAYLVQLDGDSFSVKAFMELVQLQLEQFYHDEETKLNINDYQQIKSWIFSALESTDLTQEFTDAKNGISLLKDPTDWGAFS